MHFEVTGYFKELDWIRLQKVVASEALTHSIEIQALVMMDTHFHILIESFAQKENFFCDEINKRLNGLRKFNSHCEPIDSVTQYLNTYKYIYNNPVEAGLCNNVETYQYSSVHFLLGKSVGYCLVADKLKLIQNAYQVLSWLNNQFVIEDLKLYQKAFHVSSLLML